MFRHRFFFRLFAAIMALVMGYALTAAGVFYYKNDQLANRDLDYAQRQILKQAEGKLDTYLMVASNLIHQLRTNANMQMYTQPGPAHPYAVTLVHQNLADMVGAFANFGYRIGITQQDEELVITPEHTVDRARYYQELELSPEEIRVLEGYINGKSTGAFLAVPKPSGLQEGGRSDTLTLVRNERINSDQSFVMVLSLSGEQTAFPLQSPSAEGFGIISRDGVAAFQTGLPESKARELMNYAAGIPSPDNGSFQRGSKDGYQLYAVPSSIMQDWSYVYFVRDRAPSLLANKAMVQAAAVYFLLCLLGATLALLLSRRMARPVSRLVQLFSGVAGTADTRDEFAFVQEAATRIQLTNQRLRQLLDTHQAPLRTHFVRELVSGMVPRHRLEEGLTEHGLSVFGGPVLAAVLEFSSYRELEERYSRELVLELKAQLAVILAEQLAPLAPVEIAEADYRSFAIIAGAEEPEALKERLCQAMAAMKEASAIPMVAAIGRPVESLAELELSYRNAIEILDHRFAARDREVLTWEDMDSAIQGSFYYPTELEAQLMDALLRGKEREAEGLLERVLEENLQLRRLTDEVLAQFHAAVMTTVNRIMQQIGKKPEDFFGVGLEGYTQLKACPPRGELRPLLEELFAAIIAGIRQLSGSQEQTTIHAMIRYIQEHYQQDLSLQHLAERFSLSPGYVSALFKSGTGENFKDYLNLYRVKKAKEIMGRESIRINELALRVGCTNSHTFIRMFKKYEGVPPGQYLKEQEEQP